jgi:hypothetical protein
MTRYDAFNGDADGICALHQLRLAEPGESVLVTGVKREIDLVRRIEAGGGDEVTVLDVSFDKNRDDVVRLLEAGAAVRYFDHHYPGEVPDHPHLEAHIDTSPETCTSLLVDDYLQGMYRPWAIVAAFGDNLEQVGRRVAEGMEMEDDQIEALRHLGIYLNYNGYGVELEDLFFAPDELYRRMQPYEDPFAFIAEEPAFEELRSGYEDDMAKAEAVEPQIEEKRCALYVLPEAPWARRVGGVFGNALAQQAPGRAHALLSELPGGGYRVSVRAPLTTREGADELCRAFPSGGGRKAAAGINLLPADQFDTFVERFRQTFAG